MQFLRKAKLVAGVIAAILAVVVVLQNTETVDTKILFTTISMPRAALLFITLVIGFLLGALTASRFRRSPKT